MAKTTSFAPCFFCDKPTRHAVPVGEVFIARCGGCRDRPLPDVPAAKAHSAKVSKLLGLLAVLSN